MFCSEFHRKVALFSVCVSILTLLALLLTIPTIYMKSQEQHLRAFGKAARFRETTNQIWSKMMELRSGRPEAEVHVQLFSRVKRDPFGNGFCKGCFQLSCPTGLPGPPGSPGPDGRPGEAGNQGFAGEDGFDVQLESEPEMPCVVCPSGPPGPRGPQGERGRQGSSGTKGEMGPDGNPGIDGMQGEKGSHGPLGSKGPEGPTGLQGKTAVSGIGIKGPKGPAGPMGMKGPPGPSGRNSNLPGETGSPGPAGPTGPPGDQGMEGQEGPYGPPGEPGMPASYCPSDCGVQQILANVMPENPPPMQLPKHASPEHVTSYSGYGNSVGAGGYRLHDDPTFQAKLARKMKRRREKLALKIKAL